MRGAAPGASGSLADAFDPRRNLLTPFRLVLAVTVAVSHAFALGLGRQPRVGATDLGDLAVDVFFVLSGFLVTASLLRLGSVPRYLWHRALRIMPGFWVCLAVTAFVVAPLVAVVEGRSPTTPFTTGPDTSVGYVVNNAALLVRQFGVDGILEDVPYPHVLDGSLWTLVYEAACYLLLAAVFVLRLLRSARATLVGVGVLWAVTVLQVLGVVGVGPARMLRFSLLFGLGALAWLLADRIPVAGRRGAWALAVSLAVLVPSVVWLPDYRAVAGWALAYVCLRIAVAGRTPVLLEQDVSYGVYVYHWPVLQVLVSAGVAGSGVVALGAAASALTVLLAAASWRWVERPALRLKDVEPWSPVVALGRRGRAAARPTRS